MQVSGSDEARGALCAMGFAPTEIEQVLQHMQGGARQGGARQNVAGHGVAQQGVDLETCVDWLFSHRSVEPGPGPEPPEGGGVAAAVALRAGLTPAEAAATGGAFGFSFDSEFRPAMAAPAGD